MAIWVGLVALSVLTGLLNVWMGWNGLSVSVASITLDLTVYPPFLIALLLTVWLGPSWGVVPLYLANVASALASGMPVGVSAVFALAAPVELILIWGSMVLLNVDPTLRSWRDIAAFLAIGLIAATASSLATPIWNSANGLDFMEGLRVWRGWVVGDLAQIMFVGAPLLIVFTRRIQRSLVWRFPDTSTHPASHRAALGFVSVIFILLGALAFVGVQGLAQSLGLDPGHRTPTGELLSTRLKEIAFLVAVVFLVLMLTAVVYTAALSRLGERDRRLALRDPLTGLLNRRAFPEVYDREAARSRRLGQGLSVLFADLDRFKALNDEFGHVTGDRVLQEFAEQVEGLVRDTDFVFRWGGEEFLVLLPHTAPEEAPAMAERIRASVARSAIRVRGRRDHVSITVSIGATGSNDPPRVPDSLIARADAAAYRAKANGRNRVEFLPADATS